MSLLTIPCTIQKKDELIPNAKFYSQFCKLHKDIGCNFHTKSQCSLSTIPCTIQKR